MSLLRSFVTLFTLATAASALPACKSACKPAEPDAFWSAHADLVPPGGVVCATSESDPCTWGRPGECHRHAIQIDVLEDDNPWVTAVRHLEAHGFERTTQDTTDKSMQTASFVGPEGVRLRVEAYRRQGFRDRRANRIDIHAEVPTTRATHDAR